MSVIIDGRTIAKEILQKITIEVAKLSFKPVFCDLIVGEDAVSMQYVNLKGKRAQDAGMEFQKIILPENSTTEQVLEQIHSANKIKNMCGLIVQLPLPKHIDRRAVTEAIDLNIDVDSLTEKNSTQFYSGQKALIFPAALAVLEILDSTQIDLKSKNIVMLGEGELVGKPVAYLLRNRGLAVTTINKSTENKKEILKNADVIISAIGVPKFLSGDMIKEGSIIIDAGTSESEGGIAGDVDFESVKDVAGYISPVPGGVGPVTVSMLLQNVLEVAESKL